MRSGSVVDVKHTVIPHKILIKDLFFQAYIMKLSQQILPTDNAHWKEFTNFIIEQPEVSAHFVNKLIFRDVLLYHLDGFVNGHNKK